MTTIGYGDITPKNPIEAVFTLFIMVNFEKQTNLYLTIVNLLRIIWLYFELYQLNHR